MKPKDVRHNNKIIIIEYILMNIMKKIVDLK